MCSPEEPPGVWVAERSEGWGGDWGGPPRPGGLRKKCCRSDVPYNRGRAGKWVASREGVGGGRSTARADGTTEPAVMGRAATSSARRAQGRAGECQMATTTEQNRVRELQRALYRAAKADPGRRFHALFDKVYRRDVLERAWGQVRANRGAAGIDRETITAVEQYGVSLLLDELAADLKEGRWRPLPARRVLIPKPGREERRPLSIPTVRDRVVQAATKIVIEPIFEA